MSDDARTARADAKVAKAKAKALRPWYAKKRYWLLAVIAIIIVAGIAAGSSSSKSTSPKSNGGVKTLSANGSHPPQADVSLTGCASSLPGFATANLAITNHSSGQSDYIVTVAFDSSAGVQLGTGTGLVQNVDGGQKAVSTADGSVTGSTAGMKCVVKQVDRTASN